MHPLFEKNRTTWWDNCEDIVGPWAAEGWGANWHFFDRPLVLERREAWVEAIRKGVGMRKVTDRALAETKVFDHLWGLYSLPLVNKYDVRTYFNQDGRDWVASVVLWDLSDTQTWAPGHIVRGDAPLSKEELATLVALSPALSARVVFRPDVTEWAYMRTPRTIAFRADGCYVVQAYAQNPQLYLGG